ncbi:MAG: choice-of-anchor L domain-containing protein [Bacteroidales bacterium]|nr:choice-of-anchor L domain-containing protein [Bacteroidales bacterium]
MRKIRLFLLIVAVSFAINNNVKGQVTVNSAAGMSVATVVQNNFIADGVELVTTAGLEPKFNGQTTVGSTMSNGASGCQMGIFTNADTTGTNMPINAGIVLVTGNYTSAAAGNHSGIESNDTTSLSNNCYDYSPALYTTYHSQGDTLNMNDVACLTFYVIPKSNTLSFKYSFASEEYANENNGANFVCSNYNDVFGLFITGPLDESGNIIAGGDDKRNIALIPPDYTTPVTINTINGGTSSGSVTPCILTNSNYHRTNTNDNCKMDGYTVELSTLPIDVWACYMYKLELAVCNISDHNYNSAVYLKANSLQSQVVEINNIPTKDNGAESFSEEGYKKFIKGCASDTLKVSLAFAESNSFSYNINIQPSEGSTLTQGVDYTISDEQGNTTGTTFYIPAGETESKVIFKFLHNEEKAPGTVDTLYMIPEFINDCTPVDTIRILLEEPVDFVPTITGGKTYCANDLPAREFINISGQNAKTYLAVSWENSLGESGTDTIRFTDPQTTIGDLTHTLEVMVREPVEYVVTVSDSCGRSYEQTIVYKIQAATTQASVDRAYICEGESVQLSCPETEIYNWTSFPADASLAGVATQREPVVSPTQSTLYTVTITDENECVASDTVRVIVVPAVVPRLTLTPHITTLSSSNVTYTDITVGAARREWDFGDGTTSTAESGIHTYPTSDTGTYVVTLVAYNAADCAESITDTIIIKPDFTIYFPNAIESGTDDITLSVFQPRGTMEWFRLDIYNRWGTKIFEGKDNEGWNGRLSSGELAPQGTYVYDCYYTDGSGLLQRKTGSVATLPKSKKK